MPEYLHKCRFVLFFMIQRYIIFMTLKIAGKPIMKQKNGRPRVASERMVQIATSLEPKTVALMKTTAEMQKITPSALGRELILRGLGLQ